MNPNLEPNWKNWKYITDLIYLKKIRERIEPIGGIVCGQRGEWTLILVRETERHSVRNRKAFSSSILIPMHLTISMSLSIFVSLFLCICLSMKSKSFKTWFISLFLMPNRCDVHRSTSFSVSFSVSHPLSISSSFFASFSMSSSPLLALRDKSTHITSLYLCVPFNFNWLFFVIYNERILNGVVALPNNIIYRLLTHKWQNFKWSFFLHVSTPLIAGKGFCYYI